VQHTCASLLLYLADIFLFCAAQCEKEYHVGCLQSQWQVELKVSAERPYYSIEISHYLNLRFAVHDIFTSDGV
jgi:hypothetical protein